MRILLDETLPRKLKREFTGHVALTAPDMGWAGKQNGDLLRLAEKEFDVFMTVDRNLQYQQNLRTFRIAVILLVAPNNRFDSLRLLVPKILEALPTIQAGEVIQIA